MSNGSAKAAVSGLALSQVWTKVVLGAVLVGLVYYAFAGQPVEGPLTCYQWLRGHWRNVSNYSHGPLIPLIAIGLVWWKWPQLRRQPVQPTSRGLGIVGLAMVVYYLGVKGGQPRVVVVSFVLLLYGLVWSLAGRAVLRVLFFPITFLFLMVPLNFLDQMVGFPLRTFVAVAAAAVLNWCGIQTMCVGTGIYSSVFRFDVADPCSGIRSLMALTTVTAAYAYVTQRALWKQWVLFLSAMPLAVLGNLARVTSIALVAQVYGQELASKAYHDWSGYIVFGVALGAMVLLGMLLNLPYRQLWRRWMQPLAAPPPAAKETLHD